MSSRPTVQDASLESTRLVASAATGKLAARVERVCDLNDAVRTSMWELLRCYYDHVTRESFDRDLDEKNRVILLRDSGDGSLRGLSTLHVYDQRIEGRRVLAVFSGDTVIDHAYWGQSALHWAFLTYMVSVKLRSPLTPVYWFLISKGYKTYLLLARNFPTHYPRHDAATPPMERALIGSLARARFGDAYEPDTGLICHEYCKGRLRDGVAPIAPSLRDQPDIAHFVRLNPGHEQGHELCCIGRVDLSFMTFGLRRLLTREQRRTP